MGFTRVTYAGVGLAATVGLGMSGTVLAQARESVSAAAGQSSTDDSQVPDRKVSPLSHRVRRIMRHRDATPRSRQ